MHDEEEVMTVEDVAGMSTKEVLDLLLFKSHFKTVWGPPCQCKCERLTRFLGMLPNELCESSLEEVELDGVNDFETKVSALCSCQQPHFFILKKQDEDLTFENSSGRVMDSRSLRLPNF